MSARDYEDPGRTRLSSNAFTNEAAMPANVSGRSTPQSANHSRTSSGSTQLQAWKVVTIGDSGVGKTSAITCAVTGEPTVIEPTRTMGPTFVPTLIQGVTIQLWDTAGQPNMQVLTKQALQGAHYVLFVFAINDVRSFEHIANWRRDVRDVLGDAALDHLPATLIGNKVDLEDEREVPRTDALALAQQYDWNYVETSARSVELMRKCMMTVGHDLAALQDRFAGEVPLPTTLHGTVPRQSAQQKPILVRRREAPKRTLLQRLCCCGAAEDADDSRQPLLPS